MTLKFMDEPRILLDDSEIKLLGELMARQPYLQAAISPTDFEQIILNNIELPPLQLRLSLANLELQGLLELTEPKNGDGATLNPKNQMKIQVTPKGVKWLAEHREDLKRLNLI
jgi:hypothetical protein